MTKVIPGQYITPAYDIGEDLQVSRFYPSKGSTVAQIEVKQGNITKKIPVIVATILGTAIITEIVEATQVEDEEKKDKLKSFMVSVVPKGNAYINYEEEFKNFSESSVVAINLPRENDIVLVKVTKITARQAYCEILSVEGFGNVLQDSGVGANSELSHLSVAAGGGSQPFASHQSVALSQSTMISANNNDLGENFKGVIRSQDVRLTDRDKVRIIDSFKPGDVVRAVIISLGDGSNYYLSTARNDLGVLFAKSEGGSGDLMFPIDWQTMVDRTSGVIEKRKCAKPFRD